MLQEQISALEKLLDGVEERAGQLVEKPATRVQACQLLATTKQLRREVEAGELPDLEAEYTDEEVRNNFGLGLARYQPHGSLQGDRLDEALDRYNAVRQRLAETQAKAETLCVCWDKLDQDVSELTTALTNGGGSKVTMDRLEQSINTLKGLFLERESNVESLGAEEKEM